MGRSDTDRLEKRIRVLEEHVGALNAWKGTYDKIVADNTKAAQERQEAKKAAEAEATDLAVAEEKGDAPVKAPKPARRTRKAKGGA